jgi:futalosine hydrolase
VILLAVAVGAELGSWRTPKDVELLVTGIGPVEASCAVAAALARREYRLVVNAGLGGAFEAAAAIGDGVVIAEDTMELSLETGSPLALPRGIEVVETARSQGALVQQLRAQRYSVLRGITVSRVTASETTARRLARDRGAQVESMEGFAVLRAAELANVSAIELRGISNRCGPREAGGWDFGAGVAGLHRILEALFALDPMGEQESVT